MPRNPRSKPSNVVKSRSAPSLLGGFSSSRQPQDHLPSNRFIELGDIALGNSRRHEPYGEIEVPTPIAPESRVESEGKLRTEAQRRAKPSKTARPIRRSSKPQQSVAASRPKVLPPPLTRPKPPRPPAARPNLALPPKFALPKPPKIYRPKLQTGRPSSTRRGRPE